MDFEEELDNEMHKAILEGFLKNRDNKELTEIDRMMIDTTMEVHKAIMNIKGVKEMGGVDIKSIMDDPQLTIDKVRFTATNPDTKLQNLIFAKLEAVVMIMLLQSEVDILDKLYKMRREKGETFEDKFLKGAVMGKGSPRERRKKLELFMDTFFDEIEKE